MGEDGSRTRLSADRPLERVDPVGYGQGRRARLLAKPRAREPRLRTSSNGQAGIWNAKAGRCAPRLLRARPRVTLPPNDCDGTVQGLTSPKRTGSGTCREDDRDRGAPFLCRRRSGHVRSLQWQQQPLRWLAAFRKQRPHCSCHEVRHSTCRDLTNILSCFSHLLANLGCRYASLRRPRTVRTLDQSCCCRARCRDQSTREDFAPSFRVD